MPDSLHEVSAPVPPGVVFDLLTTEEGLRRWWTGDSTARAEVGHVNVFRFGPEVAMHFRVDRQDAPRSLRWTCVDGEHSPPEWVGTTIEATIDETEGGCRLRFSHCRWRNSDGAFAMCNTTWGELMYRLAETAAGKAPGPRFQRPTP